MCMYVFDSAYETRTKRASRIKRWNRYLATVAEAMTPNWREIDYTHTDTDTDTDTDIDTQTQI